MSADRRDVATRLAEGRPAAAHTQSYVGAAHLMGYAHPDLTSHPGQVWDYYDDEDGLDLLVLDADCAGLWAAVTATEAALATQRAQAAELAAAWSGPGSEAAAGFLQRHCDAAAAVADAVRAAAEGCSALRDTLWQLVDTKVSAAVAIDDRRVTQRPVWLAAAQTLTTGAGDRTLAEQVVDQQVKPYVDNDIRTDWLTVMQTTRAAIAASYDTITDGLAAAPPARFEIPGDFGPRHQVLPDARTDLGGSCAPVAPAPAPAPVTPAPAPAPAPAAVTPAALPDDAVIPPPAAGSDWGAPFGGGVPAGTAGTAGFGGLGRLIGDTLGGLLAQPSAGLDDTAFDPVLDDDPDEHLSDDPADDLADDPADDPADERDAGADEDPPGDPVEEVGAVDPAPPDASAPPPATDAAVVEPHPDAAAPRTPCETAADALPQAGQ